MHQDYTHDVLSPRLCINVHSWWQLIIYMCHSFFLVLFLLHVPEGGS